MSPKCYVYVLFFQQPMHYKPRCNMYPRLSPGMVCYLFLGPAELTRMCLSF